LLPAVAGDGACASGVRVNDEPKATRIQFLPAAALLLIAAGVLSACAPRAATRTPPQVRGTAKLLVNAFPPPGLASLPPVDPADEPVDLLESVSGEDRPESGADGDGEDLAQQGEGGAADIEGPLTESPLDDLAEVDPRADAADLARSRDLVAEGPVFDIPVPVNDRVLAWIDLYTDRFKGAFEAGLARSGRYMDRFRAIFAEEGVPQDLVYMAHVESSYKTTAYSRAHARGIFQFIASTARLYGLRVDAWVDERADPEKSARAAARYMKKLYADFGDWHLALAAYNAGEGKVNRAIERSGSTDFWRLAQTPYLKRETKNHVPAVLAAAVLSKEPAKYGLTFAPEAPLTYDTISVEDATDLRVLARVAGTDYETLRQLNPGLRRDQTPHGTPYVAHVPEGRGAAALAALSALSPAERMPEARYVVRRGDTLSAIAGRLGVSVREIQAANGMGAKTLIHSGQRLRVPGVSALALETPAAETKAKKTAPVVVHRVQSGDTLSTLARRYSTTPEALAAASGVAVDAVLTVGQRLTVVPGVRSVSKAVAMAQGKSADRGERRARIHTVRPGETLSTIASRYRTSVHRLCSINAISPRGVLYAGAALTVGFD